jgi:hypothetical protein
MVDIMTVCQDRYWVSRHGLRWYVYAGTGTRVPTSFWRRRALASFWKRRTAMLYASNLLTAFRDGEFVGRSAVCVSLNELVCYSPCDKHRGGQFTMFAGVAPPIKTICPCCPLPPSA